MTTNKSVERLNAPQETATDCDYVVCRLLCRRSDYSQTSASRWITTEILLGIMQCEYTKRYSTNVSTPLYYQWSIGKETMFPKFPAYQAVDENFKCSSNGNSAKVVEFFWNNDCQEAIITTTYKRLTFQICWRTFLYCICQIVLILRH